MVERRAINYICDILQDDFVTVETVMSEISKAPFRVRRYLERKCSTLEKTEEFLRSHEEDFMVENGKVAVNGADLESGREKAVDYFENELSLYDGLPDYLDFRGHIGQAKDDVIDFINGFYPGEEFRQFLLAHPDVFVLFDDNTVALVEDESVDYFEECLEDYGDGLYFANLRGHIGQAPEYIKKFIKQCYPGNKFLEFLKDNSDAFRVENGYVYMNTDN